MTELAKEAFASRNYRLAVEMYERTMKQQTPSFELLFGYGDSLAKCGRIMESIGLYSRCLALSTVPPERLRYLAGAILEKLDGASNTTAGIKWRTINAIDSTFGCSICGGTLFQPVTTNCGHTYCKNCVVREELDKSCCRVCGQNISSVSEVNVLVQRLIEKWWPREAEASRARHEGDLLMKQGHLSQALERYNLAVHLAPNSPLHFSNRAHVLMLLNRPQASLMDADHAVRLRPDWGKGHFRRGIALSALGRLEEALYALCISVTIDKNPHLVRHELTRILHRVLSSGACHQNAISSSRTPYNLTESASRTRSRHQLMNPKRNRRAMIVNSSDCEDNSSGGEEEYIQTIGRRLLSNPVPYTNIKLQSTLDRVFQDAEKLKKLESRPAEVFYPPFSSGTTGELECILCCRLLWKPVTTPCGHTYCWMCLDRCLDYSSACPLCVTSLADYLASSQKTVTDFVEKALKIVAPSEYASRAANYRLELIQELGLFGSEQIGVFICTTAFPCVACPLFVYEPRYRLMTRRCVESGARQFGIAACLNKEATGSRRYAEYGTMLEIRDRVLMKDGCSILSTVGGRRFRVLAGGEKDGYDTAQVEFLKDTPVREDQLMNLSELHDKVQNKGKKWWDTVPPTQQSEIQRVFGEMPDIEEDWLRLPDGPAWTWWLLSILPLGPQLQVGILGTTSLEKRLRAIEKTLDHMEQRQLTIASTPSENTKILSSICRNRRMISENPVSVVQQS